MAEIAKRVDCAELAPAFARAEPPESASKLDAVQTLRAPNVHLYWLYWLYWLYFEAFPLWPSSAGARGDGAEAVCGSRANQAMG